MKILDATASNRSMWYQKTNQFTTFLDQRKVKEYGGSENCLSQNNRIIKIFPDIQAEWQHLPLRDGVFDMIVFDPPHLFRNIGCKPGLISKRYGLFYNHSWRQILSDGVVELFRVLKSDGVFILKWCEVDRSVEQILKLFPYTPLFGTKTGQKNNTHWIVFIKHPQNTEICGYIDNVHGQI